MRESAGIPALVGEPRAPVRARVLGGFDVAVGGRRLTRSDWRRVAAERLVKLLLVTPGHCLPREIAAEMLWPGGAPDRVRANLRKAIHFARRALGPECALVVDRASVRLDPVRVDLDLDRLEAAIATLTARAQHGESDAAHARERAAQEVLELGALDLLPDDPYEDWLAAPRERLRGRWQEVALEAARAMRGAGRREEAHAIVARLLARDPADEAAHRLAIELYAAEGRHHATRRQFELCRTALRDLGLKPSPETLATFAACERLASTRVALPADGPLVGRDLELARVEHVLDVVAATRRATGLVIRGATGIGKSRVLQDLVRLARAAGWTVLGWQAVESARESAYAAIRSGLLHAVAVSGVADWNEPARSAVLAVVPGLHVGSALRFADRPALVTGLAAALEQIAGDGPLLIAWDDLFWLDGPSLDVASTALATAARAPILIATTLRDDEPIPDRAAAFVDLVARSAGTELTLPALMEGDLETIILGRLGGDSVEPGLLRSLHESTAGNPLFCLELMRAAREHGQITLEAGRWRRSGALDGEVPPTVRRLVARRSAALPPRAFAVLATAAELPADVPYGLLATALAWRPRTLIAALDAALASGLLVERGGGYAFAHPLYRLAFRSAAGSARRGRVRLAIARTLAGISAGDTPDQIAEAVRRCSDPFAVAEHGLAGVELGAPDAAVIAVTAGFVAGARLRGLFDNEHAAAVLDEALALWARLPAEVASHLDASTAWLGLGDLRTVGGDDAAATRAYRAAIAAARCPTELAAAYVALSWLSYRHGDYGAGLAILEEALEVIPPDAAVARGRVRCEIGWSLLRLRRRVEAEAELRETLSVAETECDRLGVMRALDGLGCAEADAGRIEVSVAHLERALSIAVELGDRLQELITRIHLVTSLTAVGRFAVARRHAARTLEVGCLMGDRSIESVAARQAAELEDRAGGRAAAADLRRRELRLLAELGGNPRNEAWAHAHLAVIARVAGDEATVEAESAAARRLARRSPTPDDADWIEPALAARRWSDVPER